MPHYPGGTPYLQGPANPAQLVDLGPPPYPSFRNHAAHIPHYPGGTPTAQGRANPAQLVDLGPTPYPSFRNHATHIPNNPRGTPTAQGPANPGFIDPRLLRPSPRNHPTPSHDHRTGNLQRGPRTPAEVLAAAQARPPDNRTGPSIPPPTILPTISGPQPRTYPPNLTGSQGGAGPSALTPEHQSRQMNKLTQPDTDLFAHLFGLTSRKRLFYPRIIPPVETKSPPGYPCLDCGEVLRTPRGRTSHMTQKHRWWVVSDRILRKAEFSIRRRTTKIAMKILKIWKKLVRQTRYSPHLSFLNLSHKRERQIMTMKTLPRN